MKFAINNIKIKSNWFDKGGKIASIGYEGYFLYITLFRYRIHNQDEDYTFATSIGSIRKEMPKAYTNRKIYDLLRLLVKHEVIRIDNLSRWDQLLKGKNVNQDKFIIIEATDRPLTERVKVEDLHNKGQMIEIDQPITKGKDEYISINLQMFQHYLDIGLDEKYFLLYTLVKKYEQSIHQGCNVKIENMEILFKIDHNTINRMIWKLNELYLMASVRESRGAGKYNYHHWVCGHVNKIENFKKDQKEVCDTITKRRSRVEISKAKKLEKKKEKLNKKNKKQIIHNEEQNNTYLNEDTSELIDCEMYTEEEIIDLPTNETLAFGHRGTVSNKSNWKTSDKWDDKLDDLFT